jgi:hypothetical protein
MLVILQPGLDALSLTLLQAWPMSPFSSRLCFSGPTRILLPFSARAVPARTRRLGLGAPVVNATALNILASSPCLSRWSFAGLPRQCSLLNPEDVPVQTRRPDLTILEP